MGARENKDDLGGRVLRPPSPDCRGIGARGILDHRATVEVAREQAEVLSSEHKRSGEGLGVSRRAGRQRTPHIVTLSAFFVDPFVVVGAFVVLRFRHGDHPPAPARPRGRPRLKS